MPQLLTEQWLILSLLLLAPLFTGMGMVICYIAGLYLPRHISIPWLVPEFPLPKDVFTWLGKYAFKLTKRFAVSSMGMDVVLGPIGSVLNTLREGD